MLPVATNAALPARNVRRSIMCRLPARRLCRAPLGFNSIAERGPHACPRDGLLVRYRMGPQPLTGENEPSALVEKLLRLDADARDDAAPLLGIPAHALGKFFRRR